MPSFLCKSECRSLKFRCNSGKHFSAESRSAKCILKLQNKQKVQAQVGIDHYMLHSGNGVPPGCYRVKSGNFGHQVNSNIHLQTVEIQMRRLLMSRLIRIFTVCLVNLFFIPIIKI